MKIVPKEIFKKEDTESKEKSESIEKPLDTEQKSVRKILRKKDKDEKSKSKSKKNKKVTFTSNE